MVSWEEAIRMGDQVSEQTTTFGMLWTEGETPAVRELEENMVSYFNVLQGLVSAFAWESGGCRTYHFLLYPCICEACC
ncbi:hypothetical protein ACFX2G_008480 [Malus domestica]